jgi:protein SCO1/2
MTEDPGPAAGARRRLAAVAVLGLLVLAALSVALVIGLPARWLGGAPAPAAAHLFHARDVSGEGWGGPFTLMDPSGRARSLEEFRGQLVVLTFGYTNCPDFCPTTLAKLAEARRLLGADAPRLQVLFVTIDPERDTAPLLGRYVPAFDPSFLGLRGSEAQTDAVTRAFHANYQILQYRGQTLVEHTSSSYVIDTRGRTRLVSPYDQDARSLAEDLGALLRAG